MADGRKHEEPGGNDALRLEDADELIDLGGTVPRELLEAARDELVNPADETDEG
jgi:hypothetical protein